MSQRWLGPLMVFLILGGVAMVLFLNLNLKDSGPRLPSGASPPPAPETVRGVEASGPASEAKAPAPSKPLGFREYPIGEDVDRNEMRIKAVWLPMVQMDGTTDVGGMIHVEADIHATEGNRNGFGKDEFVPYLTVRYRIEPMAGVKGVEAIEGPMMPMVARDGWHYGASLLPPKPGRYRVTYTIEPPGKNAGRHSDPATGVEPWWKPFDVTFDWDFEGVPGS